MGKKHTQTNPYHAHDAFFCVLTYIFTRIYMIFANVRITHA